MKKFASIVLGFLFCMPAITQGESAAPGRVLRVGDDKVISFTQMTNDLRKADIVFVGESHENPKHHATQLEIIKALNEARAPLAIGLEMFRANEQKELDQWTSGHMSTERFIPLYYDNWNMPWPLYSNIFLYARDRRIPMLGLNVPSDITRKVSPEGFSSLTKDELKQLPPGISCDVDEQYREFIRQAYEAHHGDQKSFNNFCEAQRIWDTAMAWHLTEFMKKNPGTTVVVLAGTGHSWKRGIPEEVKKQSGYKTKVILQELPEQSERGVVSNKDADYIILG